MQGAVNRFKRTIRDLPDVARLQKANTPTEVRLNLAAQFAATAGTLKFTQHYL